MTFLLSHTTALEVMRLKRFPLHLAHRDPELRLPRKAPTSAEVESWASSSHMVSQLRRPICLLAATCGASVRNDRFEVRAASTALLAASLIRLDEETAIVSPELLALELAATATRLELVLLLCELCGLYAMQPGSDLGLIQRDAPLTTLEKLATYARESGRVPGKRALSEACRSSFELWASDARRLQRPDPGDELVPGGRAHLSAILGLACAQARHPFEPSDDRRAGAVP